MVSVHLIERELMPFLVFKGYFVDQWVHHYKASIVYTKTSQRPLVILPLYDCGSNQKNKSFCEGYTIF